MDRRAARAKIKSAMRSRYALLCLLLGLAPAARAATPLPAHGKFVSHSYSLTFRAPEGLTYCRLEEGWTGSDHGTILFLTPPATCEGTGYPSSSRGFEPETTPRIEIYYGRKDDDDPVPPPCHGIGLVAFLGHPRPLCRARQVGMIVIQVTGQYIADSSTEAVIALVTTTARLGHDIGVLRALLRTTRVCAIPWQDARHRTRIMGSGRPCPAEGDFY